MAFIGTLRDKAGTWAAVFVFLAIAAFTLGDIFSGNSNILNWGRNSVGEIGGKEISNDQYTAVINETENIYRLQSGRDPGEREKAGLQQQAWDLLIARFAVAPEFEKVGSVVTDDEMVDMISGENLDQGIRQSFSDPQTGEVDRNRLNGFIQKMLQPPTTEAERNQYEQWQVYKSNLKPARERIKYENLMLKSVYVTKAEAERLYHSQNDVAELKYLYIPYFVISDTAAVVTDADYQDFYNKHKERFKTEATRDLKYVSVPVDPSAQDSAQAVDAITKVAADLKASTSAVNDSILAEDNTQGQNPYETYTAASLPRFIDKDSLVVGKVFGPSLTGETYRVAKISAVTTDTVYSASARHILITWTDPSDAAKKVAKEEAEKVIKAIKGGAAFADQAKVFSKDEQSARLGGDLGWFSNSGQQRMVKPFEDAVFNATKTGLISTPIETQFGYHIIDVTHLKTNTAYKIAIVERDLIASDATISGAFRKAEAIVNEVSSVEEFEARAKEAGLAVQDAKNIPAGERYIQSLGEARSVIQWLYREAKIGKASQVFELSGNNVVAIMTGETEKGYKSLDNVKNDIKPEVQKIVKGRQIIEKAKGLKGTLEEIGQAFGNTASVYTANSVHPGDQGLPPTIGFDPVAVGTAFSLENGKRSVPFAGENGVVIIELQNKTVAPALQDYASYKGQLEQGTASAGGLNITEAIKENTTIEDKRFKFY